MKKLKLFYRNMVNMGDLLNETIFPELFGYEVVETTHRFKCESTGIGSSLGNFFVGKDSKYLFHQPKKALVDAYLATQPPLMIWSTGFMNHADADEFPIRKRIEYRSCRGELTRRRLEKIAGKKLSIPVGDAGLLVERMSLGKREKRHSIGIIPHWREIDEPVFQALHDHYDRATFIDVREDPMTVVKQIASCDHILSSSLHGLIVADAFHIPNLYMRCTDKPKGDGYKFADYYSGYGLDLAPYDIQRGDMPTLNQIVDRYKVKPEEVERKKAALLSSFPHA